MNYVLVLDTINGIRLYFGAEALSKLPSGSRRSSTECVVAKALIDIEPSINVFKEGIFSTNRKFSEALASKLNYKYDIITWKHPAEYRFGVPTPEAMRNFIENFDEGLYPELEVQ
jgi:hypothetical protein